MAVKLATSSQKYQGLSSDEQPLGAADGATYHVVDTGEVYIFHDGLWTPDLRAARASGMFGEE